MIPGVNPRQMRQMMKKMGIQQEELKSNLVVIHLEGKDILIRNPSVLKVNMSGQVNFQISGQIEESSHDTVEIQDADVAMVAEQTGATKEAAKEALEAAKGDLAQAIVALQE